MFVPIGRLQEAMGSEGKANMMLLRRGERTEGEAEGRRSRWRTTGWRSSDVPLAEASEVRSERVFFDRRVAEVISGRCPERSR